MKDSRRRFLQHAAQAAAVLPAGAMLGAAPAVGRPGQSPLVPVRAYKRIGCEAHFTTPEVVKAQLALLDGKLPDDPGVVSMVRGFDHNKHFLPRLFDIGEGRIAEMDRAGIDMQVLNLTAPGVQIFDAATGTALARSANDRLGEACAKYSERFAGLAAIAPQDPDAAAKELERGVARLGLNGAVVSSHTQGHYLDEHRFWPIFEAAEALNVPIYIHPTDPPRQMIHDYIGRGLEGALAGFSHEVWLHVMAIMTAGVFDRFPRLKIVIGHMGEGMPLLMYRFDYMEFLAERTNLAMRPKSGIKLKRKISDYMKTNLWITTSGEPWAPAVIFCQQVLGVDRVLYAMDYPYQYVLREVEETDLIPIDYEDKRRLYQSNAEQVFSLL